jgi:hypothetical protein
MSSRPSMQERKRRKAEAEAERTAARAAHPEERRGMLLALNYTKPNGAIFQGIPDTVRDQRRATGRRAKAARKLHRGRR